MAQCGKEAFKHNEVKTKTQERDMSANWVKRRDWQRTRELLKDMKCEHVPQRYAGFARMERMLSQSEDQHAKIPRHAQSHCSL